MILRFNRYLLVLDFRSDNVMALSINNSKKKILTILYSAHSLFKTGYFIQATNVTIFIPDLNKNLIYVCHR